LSHSDTWPATRGLVPDEDWFSSSTASTSVLAGGDDEGVRKAALLAPRVDEDLHAVDPQLRQRADVPLRPPGLAQRQVLGESQEDGGVGALIGPVVLSAREGDAALVILVVHAEEVVAVEQDHPASGLEHPEPFLVCADRIGKIPHHLPGDDEVERPVPEFQALGVHLHDVGGYAGLRAVLPGLGDHPVRVVYRGDVVPVLAEHHREHPRTAADVEDLHLARPAELPYP
jgi:hypothetical protein